MGSGEGAGHTLPLPRPVWERKGAGGKVRESQALRAYPNYRYITTDEPRRWMQSDSGGGARHSFAPAGVYDDGRGAPIRPMLLQQQIGWGTAML